jgi:hypothetical protein
MRRYPGNTWFVLRQGRFDVPRESLSWELLRVGSITGGLAVAAAVGASNLSPWFVAGLAALGFGLAVARQVASAPISLTPDGVRIWRVYRFQTVPWTHDRRPASSWWRPVAMPWAEVDAVLAHYMSNPADRAKIGTGAEYDRLISYLEPDDAPQLVTVSSLPPELRRR